MIRTARRTNPTLVAATRAVVVATTVLVGLRATEAAPASVPLVAAAVAGVLAYLVADLGVVAAVAALSLPLLAVAPLLGIVFLVMSLAGVRYLGADGGRSFLVIATAAIGVVAGPAWAAVALAGFLLGASEGALAAAVACLAVEALGIGLGRDVLGTLLIGADVPLLDFARLPESMLELSWFAEALRGLDAAVVDASVDAVVAVRHPLVLVAQPALWAAGAALCGIAAREGRARRNLGLSLAGIPAAVAVAGGGALLLAGYTGQPLPPSSVLTSGAISTVIAVAAAVVYERVYVTEIVSETPAPPRLGVDAEDADVDELLTLIATAEDRLANEHTTYRTVMITDMKSFSRMTEEDGSMLTAKAIQRHRDLLLPVVERHGGHGKSTGGDGLIAAFGSAGEALSAAAEMQRTLAEHNRAHPSERELTVRIGIAEGEVVLDKRGRPFIGAAINLAARIMNLADGGQAYAAAETARQGAVPTRALGSFDLKNIAEPVQVVEIVWEESVSAADVG